MGICPSSGLLYLLPFSLTKRHVHIPHTDGVVCTQFATPAPFLSTYCCCFELPESRKVTLPSPMCSLSFFLSPPTFFSLPLSLNQDTACPFPLHCCLPPVCTPPLSLSPSLTRAFCHALSSSFCLSLTSVFPSYRFATNSRDVFVVISRDLFNFLLWSNANVVRYSTERVLNFSLVFLCVFGKTGFSVVRRHVEVCENPHKAVRWERTQEEQEEWGNASSRRRLASPQSASSGRCSGPLPSRMVSASDCSPPSWLESVRVRVRPWLGLYFTLTVNQPISLFLESNFACFPFRLLIQGHQSISFLFGILLGLRPRKTCEYLQRPLRQDTGIWMPQMREGAIREGFLSMQEGYIKPTAPEGRA